MDIYNFMKEIANWVGWPVVTILLILGGIFIFWMLNQRIEILKEKNNYLETILQGMKKGSPSALLEDLIRRQQLVTKELEKIVSQKHPDQRKIDELESEKTSIWSEILNTRTKLHRFALEGEDADKNTPDFFEKWYAQKGSLSIFCSDLDWLSGDNYEKVRKQLRAKGKDLHLYLKSTDDRLTKELAENGATIHRVRPEIRSVHRFSILSNNKSKSIIIRNKELEVNYVGFAEFKNHGALISLAEDYLDNCSYMIKVPKKRSERLNKHAA